MSRLCCFCRLCLLVSVFSLSGLPVSHAEISVQFPWGNRSGGAPSTGPASSVYHVLPRAGHHLHHSTENPFEIRQQPTKSPYAYGWFGSNPSPSWGRHFGHSRNYTQWTRR